MVESINPSIDLTHWLLRLLAYVIDSIIVGIVSFAISLAFRGQLITVLLLAWVVLSMVYFILLDIYWGTTVGKKIMGLAVQLEKGGRVSFMPSLIRNISKIFILLPVLDWVIAMVTSGEDRQQKFSDRFAQTTVVQTRQIVQHANPPPPP